jgi:hypothetical protein
LFLGQLALQATMDIWAVLQPSFNARSRPNMEIYTFGHGKSNGSIFEVRQKELAELQLSENEGYRLIF